MREYAFLPEAGIEYLESVSFYEKQRVGLGASLINEFERVLDWLLRSQKPGAKFIHHEFK